MWNAQITAILGGEGEGVEKRDDESNDWDSTAYPHFTRWQDAMLARDSVKHVLGVMGNKEVQSGGRVQEDGGRL